MDGAVIGTPPANDVTLDPGPNAVTFRRTITWRVRPKRRASEAKAAFRGRPEESIDMTGLATQTIAEKLRRITVFGEDTESFGTTAAKSGRKWVVTDSAGNDLFGATVDLSADPPKGTFVVITDVDLNKRGGGGQFRGEDVVEYTIRMKRVRSTT